MTDASSSDPPDSFGDTTIRRPRVPTPPDPGPLELIDQTDDTVIARRGGSRVDDSHSTAGDAPPSASVESADENAAYASRAAAPVRGSRKIPSPRHEVASVVPDASRIQRAIRTQARRRLAAVVSAITCLVVVLVAVLVVLLFAVGV